MTPDQYAIDWERRMLAAEPSRRVVMPDRRRVLSRFQLILRQLDTTGNTYQEPLEEHVNAPQPRKGSKRKAHQRKAAYGPKSAFDSLHGA